MLFAVKRYTGLALGMACTLLVLGLAGMPLLSGDYWPPPWDAKAADLLRMVAMSLGLIVLSDMALHYALGMGLGETYLRRYRALALYFRQQSAPTVGAAGILAATEELAFRGLLMGWLMGPCDLSARAAILLSAAAFGSAHWVVGDRRLWPFALWAVWEGILLGYVYHVSASLVVVAAVHAIRDWCGFALFAFQRRTGWWL